MTKVMVEDKRNKRPCVLATSRVWNQAMVERLRAQTGQSFILISDEVDLTFDNLVQINPEFVFFPHWSYRIDSNIFNKFECVIFHMTDLPYGRGGSPLQNLIARGIYETKVSALRCVEEMDAGPIYMKMPLSLYGSAEEIFLRASNIIQDMIIEILEKLPEPQPQVGAPTVFKRRKADDGNLAAVESLDKLFDMIRMLDADGYPNAFIHAGAFKIEFTRASMKSGEVMADVRITLSDKTKE